MAGGWVHTRYRAGRWINEIEGAGIIGAYDSQPQAVAAGRDEALRRRSEHVIHRIDGGVSQRQGYGRGPFPPRG